VANSHLDNETKQITKFTELLLYYYDWLADAHVRQAHVLKNPENKNFIL